MRANRFRMIQFYVCFSKRKTAYFLEKKSLVTEEMKHYDEVLEYL